MKERRQIALHVACGDITNVALENGKLIINVYDGMLVNLLEAGRKDIESAISWQGLDLQIEIRVCQLESDKVQMDIQRLRSIFEDVSVIKRT